MDPIIWAVLLMSLGILLVMMEIFIPSGGILGFLAFCSVVGSIIMAFSYGSPTTGLLFGGFAAIALPTAIGLSLKFLPQTAIGRKLLLISDEDESAAPHDPTAELKQLVGEIGVAKSLMLPGGTVQVNRRNYDAVSEGGIPIEPGQAVEVSQVRHERLVVRPTTARPKHLADSDTEQDLLNRPLDEMGLDDLEEPLG